MSIFDLNFIDNELKKVSPYKTKEIDLLCKRLIKEKVDVSFLREYCLERNEYHRIYFQVSLAYLDYIEQFKFLEDNFEYLQDWWHVDQLNQFLKVKDFDFLFNKAKVYSNSDLVFVRRLAYVLFIPRFVYEKNNFFKIISLLKNDKEYYSIMAEAWLISYLAMYHPEETYDFINNDDSLKYNIIGKAIQKICDSHVISDKWKFKFKELREKYKNKNE